VVSDTIYLMQQTQKNEVDQLISKATDLLAGFDRNALSIQHQQLEKKSLMPDFWQHAEAKEVMQELADIQQQITHYDQVTALVADLQAAIDLLNGNDQESLDAGITQELFNLTNKLTKLLNQIELQRFLSGKYDKKGALFSIHSGQGGTEAMDWADMLRRMYVRYFERQGWKHTLLSESQGEEAGIKAAEYAVEAPFAYGLLKRERGTHRLVRQSPFNANNLRQTSFALVEVMPLLEDVNPDIVIPDSDLAWNFSRSGGAGGQNVNKVNTAVELTHLPSGTVVRCREERSQAQNKERALQKLRAILALQEEAEFEQALSKEKGTHQLASWGNQIRNYVLHPYKLVKDTRTEVETSDTTAVLDGQIDEFIQAETRLNV